jgi:hypothetical protein
MVGKRYVCFGDFSQLSLAKSARDDGLQNVGINTNVCRHAAVLDGKKRCSVIGDDYFPQLSSSLV